MTDKPFLPISGNAYKRLSSAERLAYAQSSEGRLDALEERVAALEALLKKGGAS